MPARLAGQRANPAVPRIPPRQEELIQSEFAEPESLQSAIALVSSAGGVERARQLAREQADQALAALDVLPPSRAKRSLQVVVDYVLDRIS
jgi:all-trans-nonaprenyl-diphosphate synthase